MDEDQILATVTAFVFFGILGIGTLVNVFCKREERRMETNYDQLVDIV